MAGPVAGVCSSEFNSHPKVKKDLDKKSIMGKWNTVLVDAEMLNRNYVPQCMSAEFFQLDGMTEEIVFRVGELHSLKDDMSSKEIFAYSGQTMTLLFDNMEVPTIANQYSYQPTNKFTQFLELDLPTFTDVLVTMTCVQIRGIAPPQMIQSMEKQATFAEMRGNTNMAEQIRLEMEALSTGQMVNMYEVHARDLAKFDTPEKVEELRMEVSRQLGLVGDEETVILDDQEEMAKDRLMPVMQKPEICAITRDL